MRIALSHSTGLIAFVALIATTLARPVPVAAVNEVGLFFELSNMTNCLPDSLHFPCWTRAYLTLRDPISTSIGGWEATVEWDSNLVVALESLPSAAMNLAQFPSFSVGYPTPAAADSLTLLATLSVIALGPGALYVRPYPAPSVHNAAAPVYADGANPSNLIIMQYAFGDSNSMIASIGMPDCPSVPQSSTTFTPFPEDMLNAYRNEFCDPQCLVKIICANDIFDLRGAPYRSLGECAISQLDIRSVLANNGAEAIGLVYPNFDPTHLRRVNRTGDEVTLIDLSNVYYIRCRDIATREPLVQALSAATMCPMLALP